MDASLRTLTCTFTCLCDYGRLGWPGNERFTTAQLEHRIATQPFVLVLRPGLLGDLRD